ncbi:MAG: TonB-dependent receptor, partial [Pedobacter sp.]|nr:TonB-dependent receptor [Pedobacter sp.]
MKKVLAFCIGLMALLISSAWIAKEDPFLALIKKLEEFAKLYPTENVHLHLDKPYYAIGDDIWFKAYVTDSKTAAPTTISNVLYVELIDETDSLKKQLILPMQSGISWGDFKLADTLAEGNYRIRAYTQWMRNAGPDFFFEKAIKIGNSWANKVFVKAENLLSKEGINEKVNSTIRFTDKNEQPYTNVEVTYSAELGEKIVTKGKTETNSNGEINIPIVNTQPNTNQSGKITATLTLPDKQKVTKIIPIKTTSTAIDVQFFPESGNLIQDLPNRIAFKAINAQGKGEDIKGSVFDNDGEEITTFE